MVRTRCKSGHLVATGSLQHTRSTTTVRPQNDNVSIPDGPFAKAKEQLGVAAYLNEHLGWGIEVQPIEMFARP